MQPAVEVGGDFYDMFLLNDDTLAVVIADGANQADDITMLVLRYYG